MRNAAGNRISNSSGGVFQKSDNAYIKSRSHFFNSISSLAPFLSILNGKLKTFILFRFIDKIPNTGTNIKCQEGIKITL